MKKFDISNLTVSNIFNIYSADLAEDSEASAAARHCLLIMKQSGESIYTIGGNKYIVDSDTILFLPKGCKYSMYIGKSGPCHIVEFDVTDATSEMSPESFTTNGDEEIGSISKDLLYFWALRGPAYRSKCLSELYALLTALSSADAISDSLAGKYGLIHRSVKYIEANYNRLDLYTSTLARISGMGETYYRSIFISVFGVPPTKYIQQYRIDRAKELLLSGENSVEDIAVSVGFANSSYFCKVFKSITDQTPSEFAQNGKLVG